MIQLSWDIPTTPYDERLFEKMKRTYKRGGATWKVRDIDNHKDFLMDAIRRHRDDPDFGPIRPFWKGTIREVHSALTINAVSRLHAEEMLRQYEREQPVYSPGSPINAFIYEDDDAEEVMNSHWGEEPIDEEYGARRIWQRWNEDVTEASLTSLSWDLPTTSPEPDDSHDHTEWYHENEDDHQEEVCPVCGSEVDIQLDDAYIVADSAHYPWICRVCETTGEELHDTRFSHHWVNQQ